MFGISMSGDWGLRAAAGDPRLAALATFEGLTGDFDMIFNRAQPSFNHRAQCPESRGRGTHGWITVRETPADDAPRR
nr:hypothetical protein StreXyl84_69100 [Streptomyces sp. Xyl84]